MAYSLAFAPEAADQLEALYLDVAERASPAVAERFTRAVVRTCERLVQFPLRGVDRHDIRPGLRVTHHKGRTVIAYTVDDSAQQVLVVGIFYGGQDHDRALSIKPDD